MKWRIWASSHWAFFLGSRTIAICSLMASKFVLQTRYYFLVSLTLVLFSKSSLFVLCLELLITALVFIVPVVDTKVSLCFLPYQVQARIEISGFIRCKLAFIATCGANFWCVRLDARKCCYLFLSAPVRLRPSWRTVSYRFGELYGYHRVCAYAQQCTMQRVCTIWTEQQASVRTRHLRLGGVRSQHVDKSYTYCNTQYVPP